MRSATLLQTLTALCSALLLTKGEPIQHVMTSPQVDVVEIGSSFTATCTLLNTSEATADDLRWKLHNVTLPPDTYTRINSSSVSVTITINNRSEEHLFCRCSNNSPYVHMHSDRFFHGIILVKGYRPEKPFNLSCTALQEHKSISPVLSCEWEASGRQTKAVPITYTLHVVQKEIHKSISKSSTQNQAQVDLEVFPHFTNLEIWVEAKNRLGRVESEHMTRPANSFAKTNPPTGVSMISESTFPSSLLLNWKHPIQSVYLTLSYQIRFCARGTDHWTYVPLEDTSRHTQQFRLQNLQPYTEHVAQVRCKVKVNQGHWSDWSANATQRTPETRPTSRPDVWMNITEGAKGREVQFVCKDPLSANGRILRFNVTTQEKGRTGGVHWESASFNRSHQPVTVLHKTFVPHNKSLIVSVSAVNAVGRSPEALLGLPAQAHKLAPVQELKVLPEDGRLLVEWKPPDMPGVSEYVLEWSGAGQMGWQRQRTPSTRAFINGSLKPFVCYTVRVHPLVSIWVGPAVSAQAFVEEGVPSEAPDVSLLGEPGRNEVELVWKPIPESSCRGFITHYTLFYRDGHHLQALRVPARSTSYTLTSLSANTKYDVWMQVSTVKGSKDGSKSFFSTLKYAPGQIEGIAIGVSLGFGFVVFLAMFLCICKKDVLKKNFWPQIPDPGESTISSWSPDYPVKAELPKESCLSGISVLDMDTSCCVLEEKSSPSMKKDKFVSEEHSSGIGGSSCMSSPRHSVSDSDESAESADMADSTASTVQYSSVVASGGYKGQMPNAQLQPAAFSRSESTQPLLEPEENLELDRVLQRAPGRSEEEEQSMECLDFCPVEEEQTGSYKPQLGGYRPQ